MKYLALILSLILIPLNSAQADIGKAAQRVIDSGVIRCGYAISPPALVKDPTTGELYGSNVDLMNEIGRVLDLKIEWTEEAGWGNFIEGLRANRYDAFCAGMWPDAPRMKFISLTQPILYNVMYAYVREGDDRFDGNIEAANNSEMTVPFVEGDVTATIAKTVFPKAKKLSLQQISTVSEMMLSVTTKKADFTILTPEIFDVFDKNNPGELRAVKDVGPLQYRSVNLGVKAGEYHLRDMLNQAISSLRDDGTITQILAKYSEHYIPPVQGYTLK